MFTFRHDIIETGRTHRFALFLEAEPLRYGDAIRLWQSDEAFRSSFISVLAGVPFTAYRLETPPVTLASIDQPFAFVMVDSPALDRTPNPRPFAEHFAPADVPDGIVVFDNLGGDATLVVPSPRGPHAAYGHLAAFTREAPRSQQHALWRAVGAAMQQRLGDRPVWLSTAGGGVAWLHVRLDDHPKYYHHQPYTTVD